MARPLSRPASNSRDHAAGARSADAGAQGSGEYARRRRAEDRLRRRVHPRIAECARAGILVESGDVVSAFLALLFVRRGVMDGRIGMSPFIPPLSGISPRRVDGVLTCGWSSNFMAGFLDAAGIL